MNKVSDKSLSKHEMTLQNFIITGIERTKLASIIHGVSKRAKDKVWVIVKDVLIKKLNS